MKKAILFTALFTTATFFSFSQDDVREELKLGIKGGASLSNVYDSEGESFDADPRLGYTVGANLEIPIGEFLGIHPEVLVTQKGFEGSGSFLGANYSYRKTTTFLEIPVLLAFKPIKLVSIVAGPQFAYLMSEKNEFNSGFGVSNEETFENDDINKNILGFVGGVNLNFDHVTIGARAGFDFQKNRGNGESESPRYKNTWLQFTVGYRFY